MEHRMDWLRQHMRGQTAGSGSVDPTETALHLPEPPAHAVDDQGKAALDLVYRAADVIRGIEDRATAVEARARSLVEDAVEQLQLANNRIQSMEAERRAAEGRIQEAETAVKRAEARLVMAEGQLSQTEMRARMAETRASEAEKTLIRIEGAIRTQLLGKRPGPSGKVSAAA